MRRALLIVSAILFLMACKKKQDPVPPVYPPFAATLTAPAQNAVCTTGTIISDTQSSILFTWSAAKYTDSYNLVLKNLLTAATTTQSTTSTQLTLTLNRNTPYSWYIVSKSTKIAKTDTSETWKFYNSGPGVVTYAPYPAELTFPAFGEIVTATSGAINLTWTGSAVTANSIANYDVYFGATTTPAILKSNVTESFINGVKVQSGSTFYWKVITRDINGNTSDSGIYPFTVQ